MASTAISYDSDDEESLSNNNNLTIIPDQNYNAQNVENVENVESVLESFGLQELVASFNSNLLFFSYSTVLSVTV